MNDRNDYEWVLDEYPEYITKEQLYQICHISKKSAQNLLESGEIPCIDSGRKTHRFLIATTDVVDYLHRRDNTPRPAVDETAVEKIHAALALYPDMLSVAQVSELTGRRSSTVTKWCRLNYIENIYAGGKNHIPKAASRSSHTKQRERIVPFVDRFPKDTEMYRMMTTKFSDLQKGLDAA